MHPPVFPCQPTGRPGAAAFGMPMPLAPLMATGDVGDPTTMRTAWVAAVAAVTARRPRGGRSWEAEILVRTRPFVAHSALMVLLLCVWAGAACRRRGVGGRP